VGVVGLIDIELEEEFLDFPLKIFGSFSLEAKRRLSFFPTCCSSSLEDCILPAIFESLPPEWNLSGVIVALPPDAVETDTFDETTPTRTHPVCGAGTKVETDGVFLALPELVDDADEFWYLSTLPAGTAANGCSDAILSLVVLDESAA